MRTGGPRPGGIKRLLDVSLTLPVTGIELGAGGTDGSRQKAESRRQKAEGGEQKAGEKGGNGEGESRARAKKTNQ